MSRATMPTARSRPPRATSPRPGAATAWASRSSPAIAPTRLRATPLTGPRDADSVTVTQYDAAGRMSQQTDNWVDGTFTATEPITDRITLSQYDTLGRSTTTTLNYIAGLSDPALNRSRTTAYDVVT